MNNGDETTIETASKEVNTLQNSYNATNEEVQNLISEMFQECVGGIKKLEEKIEERNDKWKETDEKVKLYLNLKQNLKQMMFFKAGRKGF